MDSEEETSFSVENQKNKHPVEDEPKKKKAKVQRSKQKEPSSKNKPDEKDKKEWDDDETVDFIDMLKENPCLWDVFDKDYSKRDVKEIAYKSIATAFDTNISSVKTKINGLRAQLGREKAKETKTKSGQSTDELYISTWAHYNRLAFLLPVMGHSKSRETLRKKKISN